MQASTEISYSHAWINELENALHWKLYWHQLNLVLNISNVTDKEEVVEVGVGSGLVASYLKRKGYNISTVDIDKNKNPDIIANIAKDEIPAADVYLAFEILEHLPFDAVKIFLEKISKNKVRQILFSIPHAYRTYFFGEIWMPYLGRKTIHVGRKRRHINTENHHWELGIKGITLEVIEELLNDYDYKLSHSYRYRNHQFCIANLITK